MLSGKVMIIQLVVGCIKKRTIKRKQYSPKSYERSVGNVKTELCLFPYLTKQI